MNTSNTSDFKRVSPTGLSAKLSIGLRAGTSTVILDARRKEAFDGTPWSIPAAIPIFMDEEPVRLPDLDRDSSILVVCQCNAQTSSIRVARWLLQLGYRHVWILEGGLTSYSDAKERIGSVSLSERDRVPRWVAAPSDQQPKALIVQTALTSSDATAPQEMAVLFVDMVDFSSRVVRDGPKKVLALVQQFMRCVSGVAQSHCGDVRDFEGDGALVYFASPREALPAAFELRKRLAALRRTSPELPLARISIDFGPVLIGPIESERKAIAFVGAPLITAARLLKIASPEGIIVTQQVVNYADRHLQDVGAAFPVQHRSIELKGFNDPIDAFESLAIEP